MYEEFFGLTEKPFSIQPDPSFLYWGRGHRLAYAMLEYGVLNHAGISIVTGEVGCGKTTLIHRLLDQLSDTHAVALLSNIQKGRGDLLSWVLMGFGQPFAGKSHVELFSALQNYFIEEYAKGRRVVLIIDEAQNLSIDMLEELRLLSNINAGKDQLLQLILVGQPELKNLLNRPEMLQLAQRVGADFHLTALSREEIDAYLDTRLAIAGARRRIFTEPAVALIAEQSGGVPRVINIIADTALVYAFSAEEKEVGAHTVETVIRDKLDYGVFGLAAPDEAPRTQRAPAEAVVKHFEEAPRAEPVRLEREAQKAKAVAGAAKRQVGLAAAARDRPAPAYTAHTDHMAHADREARARPRPAPLETTRPPDEKPAISAKPAARAQTPPQLVEQARRAVAEAPPAVKPEAPVAGPAAPASTPNAQTRVVIIAAGGAPEATLASIARAGRAVFVAQSTDETAASAARAAGLDVVDIADRALSPGRARNAGYRQAKAAQPDLRYVQFVEAGIALDPDWLASARAFMESRPDVAMVEGAINGRAAERSIDCAASDHPPGEILATGPTALARAAAFEAAGGFRGDLPVNETVDLCIRLRRCGALIWRLEAPMGETAPGQASLSAWWSRAIHAGYEYAHGAALHGEPPEALFARERARTVFWGGLFPALIVTLAVAGAALAQLLLPGVDPFLVAAGAVGAGASFYLLRILATALKGGADGNAWATAIAATAACFPGFVGAWRYYFGGARARRMQRTAP